MATAVTFDVDPGDLGHEWLAVSAPGLGVLILEGVIVAQVRVCGRTTAEIVGTGDLLQSTGRAEEELVGCEMSWRVLVPSRLALLDRSFAERVRPWPQIPRALLRRAGRRARALSIQRAICAQPRLEIRLTLLLWHLAARWGRVEPGGIRLPIPLTHQLLGRLVSAERPSVSHALARLAQAGLVSGHGDEWHLHGTLDQQLAFLNEPERSNVQALVAEVSSLRR